MGSVRLTEVVVVYYKNDIVFKCGEFLLQNWLFFKSGDLLQNWFQHSIGRNLHLLPSGGSHDLTQQAPCQPSSVARIAIQKRSAVSVTEHIKYPVPLIEKSRASCLGGRPW